MKIFISGISGFVGRNLAKALYDEGHQISGLVRRTSNQSGLENYKLFEGNILELDKLKEAITDQDVIYNLVGIGNISATGQEQYERYNKINVTGGMNVLKACMGKNAKKIISFSSTAAMGLVEPGANEDTPCNPVTPYQRSRRDSEIELLKFAKDNNLPLVIIRPSMIYGPGRHSEVCTIAKFVDYLFVPRIGSGKNVVPGIYITDLVNAVINAINAKNLELYIVTSNNYKSLNDYISAVSAALGKTPLIIPIPKFMAKCGAYVVEEIYKIFNKLPFINRVRVDSITANRKFDVSKAIKDFDLEIKTDFETGIRQSVRWYKNEGMLD